MTGAGDGSKSAARDGSNDQAMAKRLELLGGERSKLVLREVAWANHSRGVRASVWPDLSCSTSDSEILEIFKSAVADDRLPLLEGVQRMGSPPEVQFAHLSFQE